MFTNTLLPISYSLVLIFGLATSLYLIFTKHFTLSKSHLLLSSLLVAPFILSLTLYCQFYFFPLRPGYLYIICQSLIVLIFLLSQKKHIPSMLANFRYLISKIKRVSLSSTSKIFVILFSFVFFLCTLRVFFWPINWDDQIYYIEQSYATGQSRSVKGFFDWGEFNNGIIKYTYNTTIRPGLPLVYSFASLFSNRLNTVIVLSQVMTFYFLIVSLGVFVLITRHINKNNFAESSLVSFLLIFSSYQFVSLTVMGFKELPILCITLLILDFVASKKFTPNYVSFSYLGILAGIMSFINLDGSLISCIILLMIFFLTKTNFKKKVGLFLYSLIVLTLISGLEFPYFFSWTITGGARSINTVTSVINMFSKSPSNKPTTGKILQIKEFASYGIKGNIDILTKGKLQGFFQPEFYGLIFWVFLLLLFTHLRQIVKHPFTKLLLVFIGLYYLIFIDIFGLNGNQYAYVTTVSHKYTALIIPFVSLIIGSQWGWIKKRLGLISIRIFMVITLLPLLFSTLYASNHYTEIFQLISKIIPIHNSPDYYIGKITMINNVIVVTAFICFILSLGAIVFFKQKAERYWNNLNLGSVIVIVFLFFLPSLLFFETNFGLIDTVKYSLASKEIKLSKIRGWEGNYYMVNYLNNLPKQSKILFVNSPYELIAIHLDIPSKNIAFLSDTINHSINIQDIKNFVSSNQVSYILLPSNSSILSAKYLLKTTDSLSLYDSRFTK